MDPEEWLRRKAGGYSSFEPAEKAAIQHFTFLWSIYENRLLGGQAFPRIIRKRVEQDIASDLLNPADFHGPLNYFTRRYVDTSGQFNSNFADLRLRDDDGEDLVKDVLIGSLRDFSSVAFALLLIVYRLRNNLFHGNKWDYGLIGQQQNFDTANDILMACMERHSLF